MVAPLVPVPVVIARLMAGEADTVLPYWSCTATCGWTAKAAPATEVGDGCRVKPSLVGTSALTVTVNVVSFSPVDAAVMTGAPAVVSLYLNVAVLAPSGIVIVGIASTVPVELRNVPVVEFELRVTVRAPTVVPVPLRSWRWTVRSPVGTPAAVEAPVGDRASFVAPTLTDVFALSAPTHAVPKYGVTVYFHVPSGTFVSVQVTAPVIAPPQFAFTVCAALPEL